MNTRSAEAIAGGAAGGGGMIAAATTIAPPPIVPEDRWFYAIGNEQRRPRRRLRDAGDDREGQSRPDHARVERGHARVAPGTGPARARMTARPGGTFAVDGLIEGPMPEAPGARKNLEDWSALLRKTGIRMSLEVDGSRFSLLPDATPVRRATLGQTPSRTLRDSLQQLLDAFPPAHRAAVFSTLRSAEVDGGVEVQTAYLVGPGGPHRGPAAHRRSRGPESRGPRRRAGPGPCSSGP